MGFSIPINNAKRVAQEIIDNGKATHGQLGVSVKAKAASASGFSVGADVDTVEQGSAAAKAGIRSGDVVTRFNDLAISDPNQLTAAVREQPAGRNGQDHHPAERPRAAVGRDAGRRRRAVGQQQNSSGSSKQ